MELKRTKTYTIKVDDNNNNKCSKDCEYMGIDYDYLTVCSLSCDTSSLIGNELIEDYNRTEYCKKFFENKEFKP